MFLIAADILRDAPQTGYQNQEYRNIIKNEFYKSYTSPGKKKIHMSKDYEKILEAGLNNVG